MGKSDEVQERWPNIDASDPDNWILQSIFMANQPPPGFEFAGETYSKPEYKGDPLAIVRIYQLDGSDHATWAVVTDKDDRRFLLVDDLGD
jgi:hypothetical protein